MALLHSCRCAYALPVCPHWPTAALHLPGQGVDDIRVDITANARPGWQLMLLTATQCRSSKSLLLLLRCFVLPRWPPAAR